MHTAKGRIQLENDWYGKGIPDNVLLGRNCFISSSKGFERVRSKLPVAIHLGNHVGLYDQFDFELGRNAFFKIGDYSILNSARIRCAGNIILGKYCMISWGTYISDSWPLLTDNRKEVLHKIVKDPEDVLALATPLPIIIKDNVWIGFGCVIMPGITIGEGAIVASKTIVDKNVEPYTIVGGAPMRVLKNLAI